MEAVFLLLEGRIIYLMGEIRGRLQSSYSSCYHPQIFQLVCGIETNRSQETKYCSDVASEQALDASA